METSSGGSRNKTDFPSVWGDVAVKVYGDDFVQMEKTAQAIARVLGGVRGAADLKVEQTKGLPVMNVEIDRSVISRVELLHEAVSFEIRRSGGNWREWYEVRIVETTVEVHSSIEESGCYQHGAHRWERKNSRETEEAILEAIARQLERSP